VAAAHPKGLEISEAGWRVYADEHVKIGHSHPRWRYSSRSFAAGFRQLDLFADDDHDRQKCEVITSTMDYLNRKFGKRVVSLGA
jgi:hypothetical protein